MIGVVLIVAVVVTLFRLRLRTYAESHGDTPLLFSRPKLLIAGVGLVVGNPGRTDQRRLGHPHRRKHAHPVPVDAAQPPGRNGSGAGRANVGGRRGRALGPRRIDATVLFSLLLGQIPGVFIGARISSRYNGSQELRWLLLVLVGSAESHLLGAPTWLATTTTIGGGLMLGVPIVVRSVRDRRDAR